VFVCGRPLPGLLLISSLLLLLLHIMPTALFQSGVTGMALAAVTAAAAGAAAAAAAAAASPRFVTVDSTGMFVEPGPAGRQLTLHGVAVCPKLAPFLPTNDTDLVTGFGPADMANLQAWGMNMIRLCVMWEGVMPQPGVVNATYLGLVHKFVDLMDRETGRGTENAWSAWLEAMVCVHTGRRRIAIRPHQRSAATRCNSLTHTPPVPPHRLINTLHSDYGIYTLVDAHQDALNGRLCGEGIPRWALDRALALAKFDANDTKIAFPAPFKFDLPIDPATGEPELAACTNHSFTDYYLTLESQVHVLLCASECVSEDVSE
jgi:hypothetical protein